MKKLTVICKEDVTNEAGQVLQYKGTVQRLPAILAEKLVMDGTHEYTTKNKLKSYLNKLLKLHKNHNFISKAVESSKPFKFPYSDKIYKEVSVIGKRGFTTSHLRVVQF